MPIIPSVFVLQKRKPLANFNQDHVWQRTLDYMGMEPIDSTSRPPTPTKMMESRAEPAAAHGSQTEKIHIYDLPSEAQKEIFKHVGASSFTSSADLISLSLVSKRFRDLAAEELYRNFHIVFPDEDDPSNDSPIDGLAGGLDTFVTSEYNYGQYLREIALYTLSGGEKAERAYRPYLYALSCGKFLNTLLVLTLRKATSLETFRWDIRVELSRQVFKELHRIPSLTHLHLRMQVGSTLYEPPPPLPALGTPGNADNTVLPAITSTFSHPAPPASMFSSMVPLPGPPTSFPGGNSFILGKKASKLRTDEKASLQDPPTLSGFKNLKALSIMDMDTLEYITEIKTCIRNSSQTLNKLELSFSETLASKSRKPPPEIPQDDDSDQEVDDFNAPLPGPSEDASGPAKAFRAQEERKTQEAFLGQIFGLPESSGKSKKPKTGTPSEEEEDKLEQLADKMSDPAAEFVKDLRSAASKYLSSVEACGSHIASEKSTLAKVIAQTKEYVAELQKEKVIKLKEQEAQMKANLVALEESMSTLKASAKAGEGSSSGDVPPGEGSATELLMSGAAETEQPGLFDESKKVGTGTSTNANESNPDDIKIDEPEINELSIEEGEPSSEAQADAQDPKRETGNDEPAIVASTLPWAGDTSFLDDEGNLSLIRIGGDGKPTLFNVDAIERTHQQLQKLRIEISKGFVYIDKDGCRVTLEDVDEMLSMFTDMNQTRRKIKGTTIDADEITQELCHERKEANTRLLDNKRASEYLRQTRGLMLHTLSIYLVPIKASILSKAIDLSVLQSITLLNCGPQSAFWNMLGKENKGKSLALRKIHTDNVTLPFLTLVSKLNVVTELYLLERAQKSRTESFAAKTTITMDQIRSLVLKKHASTLKVLKIKNELNYSWDINEKVALLLCKRAKMLEELAACFGIRVMHTLLQHFSGLSNLRALHIIQFRTDDTCMWVMREVRKFTVDTVSQNPDLKLQYLALDTSVERLVRRIQKPKPKSSKAKGKGKAKAANPNPEILLDWLSGSCAEDTESSDDEDGVIGEEKVTRGGLKIETIEGIRFHDLSGVKIFRNEILLGRL